MSAYSDLVLADGASNYWRLGEASGTTAVDLIGSGNGTITAGVTLGQAGAILDGNKAMLFDAAGDYVSVPAGAYMPVGTGSFTLECWLNSAAAYPGTTPFILDTGGGANGVGFALLRTSATQIGFKIANGAGSFIKTFPFPFDGAWHHVVGVLTRGATDKVDLYVDGNSNPADDSPVTGVNLTSPNPLYFSEYSGGGVTPDFRYTGLIDEVALYPTALTKAKIVAHYATATTSTDPRVFPGDDIAYPSPAGPYPQSGVPYVYTYPTPVLTSLTPSSVVAASTPSFAVVTLTGTNFTNASRIALAGILDHFRVDETILYRDPTSLQITLDIRALAAGAYQLGVVNQDSQASATLPFTVS